LSPDLYVVVGAQADQRVPKITISLYATGPLELMGLALRYDFARLSRLWVKVNLSIFMI